MKFFRRTAGYSFFYYKMTGEIFGELKIERADEKLRRCKSN